MTPAVHMLMLHPSVYKETRPLLDLMRDRRIVCGAYSCLKPLWSEGRDSKIQKTAWELAARYDCTPERILMTWCAAQGYVWSSEIKRTVPAAHTQGRLVHFECLRGPCPGIFERRAVRAEQGRVGKIEPLINYLQVGQSHTAVFMYSS